MPAPVEQRGPGAPVRVEESNGVTTVVLDDPGARNALSWELVKRTKRTMAEVAAVDDPEAAIELELVPQRWSMERPAFQASLVAVRERLRLGRSGRAGA